ncbi:MAG: serine hydrolase domain-containing protein [Lawsonibacter sp.]
MADGRYTDITVRMLLNHSSGLPGSTIANGFLLNDPDTLAADTLLEELSSQTLKADPGAFSVYCNDGFTLAELVVEAVSGMDFDDYVRQAILEPAGLEDTWFPGEDFDQSLLAKTYYGADGTRALPAETVGVHGTGGIYATASDLAAFGGAVFCEDGILSGRHCRLHGRRVRPGHLAGGHRGCGLLRPGLGQRPLVPLCLQRHSGRDQGGRHHPLPRRAGGHPRV